jgi:hypothetical protein
LKITEQLNYKAGGNSLNTAKNKMKNLGVTKFAKLASERLIKAEAKINQNIANDAVVIEGILLEVFTNENPFLGETKNKIFFTYSNHYRGNSGMQVSIGSLHHPHVNGRNDLGYIKGVATDLDGYVKLRPLFTLPDRYNTLYLYAPKFRASKNKETYVNQVEDIIKDFEAKLKSLDESRVEKANEILKAKTGLSLIDYIKNI